MSNKEIWKLVSYLSIIMILFPVITNQLMFVGNFNVAGDNKTWIGYLGSFWGAIIGGVISGAITLVGVRLTISNQDRKEFIELYPQRKMALDNYLTLIENSKNYLHKNFGNNRKVIYQGEFFDKVNQHRDLLQDNLLNVTKVDGNAYNSAKKVIDDLNEIKGCVRHDFFSQDDDDPFTFEGFVVSNKPKYNELLQNIEKSLIDLNLANDLLDEKYNRLTGNN